MTEFKKSEWMDSEHVHEFVDNADNYILERKRQFRILGSFYKHYLKKRFKNRPFKVLDLGCGDGRITGEILKLDINAEVFLVDGSIEMLDIAESHFKKETNLHFIHETFQDLLKSNILPDDFDLTVSSLAIHHLSLEEKQSIFAYIYDHLKIGGFFFNMEVVLPPTDSLEEWYLTLWKEWIQENETLNSYEESFQYLPEKYKNNPDNHPDTLDEQLEALKIIGFKNVDCYYKYGIFSVYGGEKR
jgi:tRNA (cmo5U34)-methyltransferase